MSKIVCYIDGERQIFDSEEIQDHGWIYGIYIDTDYGEYYLFEDSGKAGEAAREYWEDMANNDPSEFTYLVGEQTLVSWALGQFAGPGSTQVTSLEEWLDLWLDTPEEQWAEYDGAECEFVCKHPDFNHYTVAYRHN